jgi:hypothetical protein
MVFDIKVTYIYELRIVFASTNEFDCMKIVECGVTSHLIMRSCYYHQYVAGHEIKFLMLYFILSKYKRWPFSISYQMKTAEPVKAKFGTIDYVLKPAL